MEHKTYDFGGWATKNDLQCSDGRTIRHGAFKDCDGIEVPLVWNHSHGEPENVLGHALLENREDGVYCYGTFNDTSSGQIAKILVQHGDIKALSIYANQLKQSANKDVMHGIIREVSLVHAGANPGAFIDTIIAHSDEADEEAIIYTGEPLTLEHSDVKEEKKEEKKEEAPVAEETKKPETNEENTVGDVLKSMNEEQTKLLHALIGQAIEDTKKEMSSEKEEEKDMSVKHNVFENEQKNDEVLMHDAMKAIIGDAKRCGTLKESYLQHAAEYGIENIDWLFPDAKNLTDKPGFVKRNPDAWVSVVMSGVHHTPFSRIKMMFADLREDDARAKGYAQKGKLKKEEVFGLLKRTVTPTTIYKKQKLDRDDIVDITDFDVVSWLKGEMRMMLDEEIARAILFGDGRNNLSDDKISETNIIPIVSDASLYTIEANPATSAAKDIIAAAVRGQNNYEGSGNTTMFIANSTVTEMLLIEDTNQHRLYKNVADLALACSVNRIVKVPDSIIPQGVYALIVDLDDYNVGADKGGSVNMFDDFDIDLNQQKYLIETRCSGALRKPFSAVVIKEKVQG